MTAAGARCLACMWSFFGTPFFVPAIAAVLLLDWWAKG